MALKTKLKMKPIKAKCYNLRTQYNVVRAVANVINGCNKPLTNYTICSSLTASNRISNSSRRATLPSGKSCSVFERINGKLTVAERQRQQWRIQASVGVVRFRESR